jgi:hypothetical protein
MNNFEFEYDTSLDWSCSCDIFTDYYNVFHNNDHCATLVIQDLCQSDSRELILLVMNCPNFTSMDRFDVIKEFLPLLFQKYCIEDFDNIYYKTWYPPSYLSEYKCDKRISIDYYIDLLKYSEGRYI